MRVRDRNGEQSTFESGQTAWVDIEVTAREAIGRLAVVIWLTDETQYEIFHTSTERLGFAPFSLQPGGTYRCTFELTLNIAHGTFQLDTDIFATTFRRAMTATIRRAQSSLAPRPRWWCGQLLSKDY